MPWMAAAVPYIQAAVAVYGAYTAYDTAKSVKNTKPMLPPPAPEAPPTMLDPQVSAGGDAFRRRAAAAGGIMSNVATSSQGVTGGTPTTGKTLLGM